MTPQPIRPFPLDLTEDEIDREDAGILKQIETLAQEFSVHEKLALTLNAHWALDTSHRQLCKLEPTHGSYTPNLAAAIKLLHPLSAAAKVRLTTDFLTDTWESEATDAEEKITGGCSFCPHCNQKTWHELDGDDLKCSACLNTKNNFSSSMS